jgi:hypothetical protein
MARLHFLLFADGGPQIRGAGRRLERQARRMQLFRTAQRYCLKRLSNDYPECKRRSKNPSLEAAEWLGCAGVKVRQPRSLCLIRVRARDEGRGTLREGTTCGSN